jgi:single-stranded-DNA-specific exonuclease
MKDMDKAVLESNKRLKIRNAFEVFWDYDVDGTTAVSLVLLFKSVSYGATYIPDRYDEGYGISFKGIDFAEDNGFTPLLL